MKVVCCKNCNAKYQLDDKDHIELFECSACTGELELLEYYPNKEISQKFSFFNPDKFDKGIIVRCEDCGLKFKIKSNANLTEYECSGCGGNLRYLNPEMNRQLDAYVHEKERELNELRQNLTRISPPKEKKVLYKNSYLVKKLSDKLETYFSEDQMKKTVHEEHKRKLEMERQVLPVTARTSIPQPILSKYSKEFAIPNTNEYDVLKEFLKQNFYKKMAHYYDSPLDYEDMGLIDKLKSKIFPPENTGILSDDTEDIVLIEFKFEDLTTKHYIMIIGGVMLVLGIIEMIFLIFSVGVLFSVMGISLIFYGFFRREDASESFRTKIIRKYLLSLPEDFYIFYNVKLPISPFSINHVVVGPTGIYALLSQKNDSEDFNLKSEKDKIELIRRIDGDSKKFAVPRVDNIKHFRYTVKQANFSQNNSVKQKILALSEDLINFLNDNNVQASFVEPLVGFVNDDVVVINMPLTDEDLFIGELLNIIQNSSIKLPRETINKCAVLLSKYSDDCSFEIVN